MHGAFLATPLIFCLLLFAVIVAVDQIETQHVQAVRSLQQQLVKARQAMLVAQDKEALAVAEARKAKGQLEAVHMDLIHSRKELMMVREAGERKEGDGV